MTCCSMLEPMPHSLVAPQRGPADFASLEFTTKVRLLTKARTAPPPIQALTKLSSRLQADTPSHDIASWSSVGAECKHLRKNTSAAFQAAHAALFAKADAGVLLAKKSLTETVEREYAAALDKLLKEILRVYRDELPSEGEPPSPASLGPFVREARGALQNSSASLYDKIATNGECVGWEGQSLQI